MADEFDHHQAELAARIADAERRAEQLARVLLEEDSRRIEAGRRIATPKTHRRSPATRAVTPGGPPHPAKSSAGRPVAGLVHGRGYFGSGFLDQVGDGCGCET